MKAGEVPRYLQPTETFKRYHAAWYSYIEALVILPTLLAKADHEKAWNAGMRKSVSRTPPPPLPRVAVLSSQGSKTQDKQPSTREFDSTGSKTQDKQPSTREGESTGPRRMRVAPQKMEPAPPDPEVDLGVALSLMQLPCTDVLLEKVSSVAIDERFGLLLERILPTERRLPRPPAEFSLLSNSNSVGQE